MNSLIRTLEVSIEKHGDKPLTTQYLLNLLKLSEKFKNQSIAKEEEFFERLYNEVVDPNA